MKKTITLSLLILGLSIVSTNTQAYSEGQNGDECRLTTSVCNYNDSQQKLNKAIQLRNRYNLYNNRINNLGHKNIFSQRERHVLGRKLINVNEVKTTISREGALEADHYVDRRTESQNKFSVSNNAKQNWRRAAINYYVDGGSGYTSKIGMKEGIKLGSQHKVTRVPSSSFTRGEISKTSIRDEQKFLGTMSDNKVNKVATGKQKNSKRTGSSANNYTSPYQSYKVYDEYPNYLRTLRSLMLGFEAQDEKVERLYNSPEADIKLSKKELEFEVNDNLEDDLSQYATEDDE